MRGLQTHDIFKAMRVINSLGIRDEVKRMALLVQKNKKLNPNEIGADLILTLIGNAGDEKAEKTIYDFLSGPLEIAPEDIKTMEPLELMEKIKGLSAVIDTEAWKSFFVSLARMMN